MFGYAEVTKLIVEKRCKKMNQQYSYFVENRTVQYLY
jgi:hypothetical protein